MGDPNSETPQDALDTYKILTFRSYAPDVYKSFVYSTWLNSLRYGNEMFKLIDRDAYYQTYSKFIESILKRPTTRLRIAVLTEDEDVALGWSVDEGDILHYVFVKDMRECVDGKFVGESLRKKGVGRSLIDPGIKTFSHITKIGLSLWNDKAPNLKFNPFL